VLTARRLDKFRSPAELLHGMQPWDNDDLHILAVFSGLKVSSCSSLSANTNISFPTCSKMTEDDFCGQLCGQTRPSPS
jgi:hypothetical protein